MSIKRFQFKDFVFEAYRNEELSCSLGDRYICPNHIHDELKRKTKGQNESHEIDFFDDHLRSLDKVELHIGTFHSHVKVSFSKVK